MAVLVGSFSRRPAPRTPDLLRTHGGSPKKVGFSSGHSRASSEKYGRVGLAIPLAAVPKFPGKPLSTRRV